MNNKTLINFFLLLLAASCTAIDLSVNNKYGNGTSIYDSSCNKDTQIDFFFSADSKLKVNTQVATLLQGSKSTMKFLDVMGNDLILTLIAATFTRAQLVTKFKDQTPYYFVLTFQTDDKQHKVLVIVPTVEEIKIPDAGLASRIVSIREFSNVYDNFNEEYEYDSEFNPLKTLTDEKLQSGFSLSFFNFLNLRDYGHFYTVTNEDQLTTLLISDFIFNYAPKNILTEVTDSDPLSGFTQKKESGDKLCFGAQETEKIFQTHLRESYPLWTAWLAIMFFWLYYLIAESHTNEVYDQRFQNNKMTSWGFYSIHHLAHEDCFTRLSRLSLMLFNFSFQAVVLAAVYSTLGPNSPPQTDYSIVIWAACISLGAGLPVPFILGGLFLTKIYKQTLEKYKIIKKSKNTAMAKKEQTNIYEEEIDKTEEYLYALYYWFYIIVFAGFVSFWTASVHMMMQLHRDYFYLHRLWLASLGIVFVLDHLVFDPLLAVIAGNTRFYRIRGYFFDFEMVQEYKEIEE